MDAVYLYNKYGTPISYNLWVGLRRLVNWVCDNWRQKDEGIWEVRGGRAHFLYSKVMCWVALDRGLRLADKRSFPADRDRWLKTRDEIYEEILTKGWNEERQAFVQHYDSDALDAANLIMLSSSSWRLPIQECSRRLTRSIGRRERVVWCRAVCSTDTTSGADLMD